MSLDVGVQTLEGSQNRFFVDAVEPSSYLALPLQTSTDGVVEEWTAASTGHFVRLSADIQRHAERVLGRNLLICSKEWPALTQQFTRADTS